MATSFPSSLDSFTNPLSSDTLSSPSHAGQHTDLNDAVAALEAKVGADSSAVTSSHDYKIAQLEADVAGFTSGKILQVVSTTKTDTFTASLGGGADTAVTGLSATITPSNTLSKILVIVHGYGAELTSAFATFAFRVYRGATEIGSATGASSRTAVMGGTYSYLYSGVDVAMASQTYLDSPSTTSSTTYAVHVVNPHTTTNTIGVNRSDGDANNAGYMRTTSSITLMEVSA